MAQHVSTYLKNVAKSFGYAIGDTFTELNPVFSSLAKETKDGASSIYQTIKSSSYSAKESMSEKSLKGTIRTSINDAWKNTKDDLKSGNWYNKQRADALDNDMAKALGFDMDMNFDFDFDEDWGDESSDELDSDKIAATQAASTAQIVTAVDQVGFKMSTSISAATVESANYIVESNRHTTKAMYDLNQRGFNSVTAALMSVDTSIRTFAKIGEPLTSHMQNAATFYTKTTETLNRMDQTLQQIAKNTTPAQLATSGNNYRSHTGGLGDIFSSDTGISIDSYKQMIKDNFAGYKDLIDMGLDAVKGFRGDGGSFGKNLSPMTMITKMVTGIMIPKAIKESMKGFNESLKYFISGSLLQARNNSSGNVFVDIFKDIFLPTSGYKDKINTANYEKGRVAWDGVARKALTEVIPTALMKIYSAVSGGEEMRYDYNSGKFVTLRSIKDNKDKELSSAAKSAGGEFREDALRMIQEMQEKTQLEKEKLIEEVEAYFKNAFVKGSGYNNTKRSNFKYEEFGLTPQSLAVINKLIDEYESSSDRSKRNRHAKYMIDNELGRNSYGDDKRRQEANGMSPEVYLQNWVGSEGKDAPKFADKNGHSVLSYLEGIYNNTLYLADNIDYISGRSKKTRKRKAGKGALHEAAAPAEDKSTSSSSNSSSSSKKDEDPDVLGKELKDKNIEEAKKILDDKSKSGKQKVKDFMGKLFGTKDGKFSLIAGPVNAMTGFLDKLSFSMTKLLWGNDDNPESGIMGLIITKTKEAMNSFKSFITETFGPKMKDKFKQGMDWLFGEKDEEGHRKGGKLGDLRDSTKTAFKNIGSSIGRTTRQGLDKLFNNGQAAHGRKVTRTGIVAVSEGELIVPSELNPYYHGVTNKRSQISKERDAINNFYGAFTFGGTTPYEGQIIKETENGKDAYYEMVKGKKGNLKKKLIKNVDEGRKRYAQQQLKDVGNSAKNQAGKFGKFVSQGAKNILFGSKSDDGKSDKKGLMDFIQESLFGTKEDQEKDKKNIAEKTKGLFKQMGNSKGEIAAGAIIGAGTSLLTGAVVGPLFGAAIGGTVGFIASNENVQNFLFGKKDEKTGERAGGKVFNKEVSNFLTKNVPSMAAGGAIGGVAGLFMGSPILGAILGSTVGYVSSSEKAKEFIFGNPEKNKKGIIPKELQTKIKKAAPNMAAGALAGLALGPFGIAGNLIFGAGMGYLTTSDKFHDFMFGNKEKGIEGLTTKLHDKIFVHLDELFHNIGNAMIGFTRNLFDGVKTKVFNFLIGKAKAAKEGNGIIGKVSRFAGNAINGVVDTTGNILAGASRHRKAKNLSKGYQVYDNKLKRNMTAEERIAARGNKATGTFAELDNALAGAKDVKDLEKLRSQLETLKNPKGKLKQARRDAMDQLFATMESAKVDYKTQTKVGKLVDKGDASKAIAAFKAAGYSDSNCISAIQTAADSIASAMDTKTNTNNAIKALKAQGINMRPGANINNAIDLINSEMKSDKFNKSPEQKAIDEEKEYKKDILSIIASIDSNIAGATGGESAKVSSKDIIKKAIRGNNKSEESKDEYKVTEDGIMHLTSDGKGGLMYDMGDTQTQETLEKRNAFHNAMAHIPVIGTAIGGLTTVFGFVKDKLFGAGDGEKKEGLFSKLFSYLNGEDGPLSWLTSMLSGTKIGKLSKTIMSNISLGSVVSGIIGPALLLGGFTGKFDDLGNAIGNLKPIKGNDTKSTLADNSGNYINGKKLATDENGNLIKNENGEYQTVDGSYVSGKIEAYGENTSISAQLKKNLVTGTIMGKGSVASKVISKAGSAWGKMLGKGAEAVAESDGVKKGIMAGIASALEKIPKIIGKIPFMPKSVVSGADTIITAIYTKLDDVLAKEGAKKLGALAAKAVPVIKIVYVVSKGIDAWGNAESILGITETATTSQRVIATLIAVINALIPIIGDLIPNKVLVNIFMEIAPKLGLDVSELQAQRERATEEVNAYNEENGTNLSIEEYNQMNGKAGIITKGKNAIKGFVTNVKEQGFSYVAESAKEGLTKAANFVNEKTGFTEILKLAKAGDIKGVLTYSTADEDANVFGKVVNQLPMIYTKINALPIALVSWIGGKIKSGISSIVDKIKQGFQTVKEQQEYGNKLLSDPDSELSDFFKVEDGDPENPIGGISKVAIIASRLSVIPVAIVKRIGRGIANTFNKLKDKVVASYKAVTGNLSSLLQYTKAGDVGGLWANEVQDDPENPIGGIMGAVNFIQKLTLTIPTTISMVGHKIKDGFNKLKDKVVKSFQAVSTNYTTVSNLAKAGDIGGLWANEVEDDPENPIGGIMGGVNFMQKLMNTPSAVVHWAGGKIKEGFQSLVSNVSSGYTRLNTSVEALKELAKNGDVSGIWNSTYEEDPENPLSKIFGIAFTVNKLFQTISAIIHSITGPIKEVIGTITEGVGGLVDGVKDKVGGFVEGAKEGISNGWNNFKNWVSGGSSGLRSGGGTAFVSQYDSRYKDIPFGDSTVGEKGCGPAVATMVANSYGRNLSMNDAINSAKQYINKDGTTADYFGSVLGSKGITTNYLKGGNIKDQVLEKLANGEQVVLLGKDEKNTSKKNSPFGPNGHYVVATGIDKNGNLIINDPEGSGPTVYSSNILKNTSIGIAANQGGSGSAYDTDIARKVWSYFTSNGYSPAATAGIMANLYQESGMNPERFQNGGPAAGIAQWESYKDKSGRWAALNSFAQQMGYNWNELTPQLAFINHEMGGLNTYFKKDKTIEGYSVPATTVDAFKASTDPLEATKQFEKAFERAGKPNLAKRLVHASEYYKLYQDSAYTGNYEPDSPGTSVGTTAGTDTSSSSSSGGVVGVLSAISTAFGKLGQIFTGSRDSGSTDGSTVGVDGSTGVAGTVGNSSFKVVNGAVGEGSDKQKALAQKLLDLQGKLTYSMSGPRNPEKGSADCSSTVNWAYKQVTGTDIGNNTGDILSNANTEVIDMASSGMDATNGGSNSSGPNESKLMPGDILLYSRPKGSYTTGRPYRVGHVEMYVGNGQRIGHGGPDAGPKVTAITKDASRYIMAKRLKGIPTNSSSSGSTDTTGSNTVRANTKYKNKAMSILNDYHAGVGSGLYSMGYNEMALASGGSSGLLLSSAPSARLYGGNTSSNDRPRFIPKRFVGGASNMAQKSTNMLNNIKDNIQQQGAAGSLSMDMVEKLINAIVEVLNKIANNTAPVESIYQVLAAYTQASSAATAKAVEKASNNQQQSSSREVSLGVTNLVGTLAEIAKG